MSEPPARSRETRSIECAHLAHDVGKYVARIAHNIGDGPVPAALGQMMARDLYELPGGKPASSVFAEYAAKLAPEPELTRVRAHLEEIDRLEDAVRAGDEAALRAAAGLALSVEAELRALAQRVAGEEP